MTERLPYDLSGTAVGAVLVGVFGLAVAAYATYEIVSYYRRNKK